LSRSWHITLIYRRVFVRLLRKSLRAWSVLLASEVNLWLAGFLFGAMAVITMMIPLMNQKGLVVDCHVGVIGSTALLGGPQAALASILFPCVYLISLGDTDLLNGLLGIVVPCVLGVLCNLWYRRRKDYWLTLRQVFVFSFLVGLGTNLAVSGYYMFEAVMNGFANIGLAGAVIIFFVSPITMALLCTLLVLEQRHSEAVLLLAETERRMLYSQKMAAIGQLAHKISHSVLNSLTLIVGEVALAKTGNMEPVRLNTCLDNINSAAECLSKVTGELVAFATPGAMRYLRLDLSKCLAGVKQMLSEMSGPDIQIVVKGEHAAGLVDVDPDRIEQVIMHLAVNALEAMSNPGRISVTVAAANLSARDHARIQSGVHRKNLHHGTFAVLSVQDTGCGMTEEVVHRIFEPFFTTKERRENVGLGLSTVYNIVQRHHGFIDIKSSLGAGTGVHVYLPVVSA
jgi:signal transduction histidine kinase